LSNESSASDSDDSINRVNKCRKQLTKTRNRHATELDTFSSSDEETGADSEGEQKAYKSVGRTTDVAEENGTEKDDEDEEVESARKVKARRINEQKKKPRICFQVIRRRRECNSNFDSANDDYDVRNRFI
jgi:hypothetical protein